MTRHHHVVAYKQGRTTSQHHQVARRIDHVQDADRIANVYSIAHPSEQVHVVFCDGDVERKSGRWCADRE